MHIATIDQSAVAYSFPSFAQTINVVFAK